MSQLMDSLVLHEMNGLIKSNSKTFGLVGTILFLVLGKRIRDWQVIVDNEYHGYPIPEGLQSLRDEMQSKLIGHNLSISDLYVLKDQSFNEAKSRLTFA